MTSYVQILSLAVQHDYFLDDASNGITMTPAIRTEQWLQSRGMEFFQKGNTGYLVAPSSVARHDIAGDLPDAPLEWNITSNDPNFVYYTDIPLAQLGQLVFYNQDSQAGTGQDIDLEVKFIDSTNMQSVSVVAQISLSTAILEDSPRYFVKMQTRALRWKYYIINQSDQQFEDLQLQGIGHDLFTGPTPAQLPDGTVGACFDSGDHRIPIDAGSTINLSLLGTSENTGLSNTILIDRMPHAQPGHIQYAIEAGKRVYYTAIYVYL